MRLRALCIALAAVTTHAAAQPSTAPLPAPPTTDPATAPQRQPAHVAEKSAGPARNPDAKRIARALERYAHEPTVQSLVEAALRAAGNDPARMRAMAGRARTAGWVPRVQLTGRRGQAIDLSSASQDGTLRASTDDDLMLQASLTFDLPRVVFARSEIGIAAERRAQLAARRTLVREVVTLYFERRRLQLQRDLVGDADLSLHARLMELHALLDVFTNGALSRMMATDKRWKTDASSSATTPR